MTDDIENIIKSKNKHYRRYTEYQRQISGLFKTEDTPNEMHSLIMKFKEKYYNHSQNI